MKRIVKQTMSETFHQQQKEAMSRLGPTHAKEITRRPIMEKDRTPLQWKSPLVEEPGMCKKDSEKSVEQTDISEHTGVPVCMHDEEIRGGDGTRQELRPRENHPLLLSHKGIHRSDTMSGACSLART